MPFTIAVGIDPDKTSYVRLDYPFTVCSGIGDRPIIFSSITSYPSTLCLQLFAGDPVYDEAVVAECDPHGTVRSAERIFSDRQ